MVAKGPRPEILRTFRAVALTSGELGRILTYLGWGDIWLFNFLSSSARLIIAFQCLFSIGGVVLQRVRVSSVGHPCLWPGMDKCSLQLLCWTPASAVRRGVGRLGEPRM